MTRRLVGVLVAGATAHGLASGAVGTIVAHDTTTPRSDFATLMADHMGGYDMGSMPSCSMMGPGWSFGPGIMWALDGSSMPGARHDLHHRATAGGSR